VMMVCAPISGSLTNRLGYSRLISLGMVISGIGTLLYMRASVDGRYLDLLPSYIVMGFGMSLIFAPMTTAVLNSVESNRSGVASAVNGAIREVGNAFGIALLGTLMNRTYQSTFNADAQVQAARSDPALGGAQAEVDTIGSGMAYGGNVVDSLPGLEGVPQLVATLRAASGDAFMAGMDIAIYVSSFGMIAMAVVSYFLIRDRVAQRSEDRGMGAEGRGVEAVPAD